MRLGVKHLVVSLVLAMSGACSDEATTESQPAPACTGTATGTGTTAVALLESAGGTSTGATTCGGGPVSGDQPDDGGADGAGGAGLPQIGNDPAQNADHPPVSVASGGFSVPKNGSAVVTLAYTDADGDEATDCAVQTPTHLTLGGSCACVAGACSVSLTAESGYAGVASFSFTVTAGGATSAPLAVDGKVDAPPVAQALTPASVAEETEKLVTLAYTDENNEPASACSTSTLTNVTVSSACVCVSGVCTVGVTGLADYYGSASFAYQVTAGGAVSAPATVSFEITDVLDAPGAFTITGVSSTVAARPTYSWQAAPLAGTYDVKVATDAGCSQAVATMNDVAATSVALPASVSLTYGTYFLCVTAKNAAGNRLAANNGLPVAMTYPTGTFTLLAPSGEGSDRTPYVSWTAQAGVGTYDIVIASTADCRTPVRTYTLVPAIDKTVPDADQLPYGDYFVCALAVDGAGNGKTASNNGLPFSVTSLGSFSIWFSGPTQDITPYISWGTSTGATLYSMSIWTGVGCSGTQVLSTATAGTSYTVPGGSALAQGTYYLCVVASNGTPGDTRGPWNPGVQFIVDATPGDFTIIPLVNDQSNETMPVLTWNHASAYETYSVKVATSADCSTGVAASATGWIWDSWQVTSALTPGVTYHFCVTALGLNSTSKAASNTGYAFVVNTTPPGVGGGGALGATPTGANWSGIELSWTEGSDDASAASDLWYEMYWSTSNNLGSVEDTLTNGTLSGRVRGTDHGLLTGPGGTLLYVNVLLVDTAGNRTAYTSTSATTGSGTIAAGIWDGTKDDHLPFGDDSNRVFTLPFGFPYFGRTITAISVSTNGQIILLESGEDCVSSECATYDLFNTGQHVSNDRDVIFSFDADNRFGAVVRMAAGQVDISFAGTTFADSDPSGRPVLFRVVLFSDGRVRWLFHELSFTDAWNQHYTGVYDEAGDVAYEIPGGSGTVLTDGASALAFEFNPAGPAISAIGWPAGEVAVSNVSQHVTVTLPFTFPYRGRSITQVDVDVHGLVELLETAESCTICGATGAYNLGNLAGVDALMATHSQSYGSAHIIPGATSVDIQFFGTIAAPGTTGDSYNFESAPMIATLTLKNDGDVAWRFYDVVAPSAAQTPPFLSGMYEGPANGPMGIPGGSASYSGWDVNQIYTFDNP